MTIYHAIVIALAVALVGFCIASDKCSSNSLPTVIGFAGAICAGAFGHAGNARQRYKDVDSALPREPRYDSGEGQRRHTP